MASPVHRDFALILATAALFVAGPKITRADDIYIGNSANWSDPTAWSNNAPPVSTDNVFILPSNPTGTDALTLDTTANVANLVLGNNNGGTVLINLNSRSLDAHTLNILSSGEIVGSGALLGTINNAGTIVLNSSASLTVATNSGLISLVSSTTNSTDLQLAAGSQTLDNTGGTLSVSGDPNSSVTNTFLDINASGFTFTGGNISAANSSALIRLHSGTITDVTVSGNVQATGGTLQDVTFASGNLSQSGLVVLAGVITNNDTWTSTSVNLLTPTTINGSGTIILSNSADWSGAALTIGANQTLAGDGNFNAMNITNAGTIVSNSTLNSITISVPSNGYLSNNGTLSAVAGGHLLINANSNSSLINDNGILSATGRAPGNGPVSDIDISGSSISGGQLNTDALGTIHLNSSNLSNLQINGNLLTSSTVTLNGSVTNNGNWIANGTIVINGSQTLDGNGTIALTAGVILPNLGNATVLLSLASTQKIKGYGTLGNIAFPLLLNNAGNITATPTPTGNTANFSPLTLYLPQVFTPSTSRTSINSGTLSAVTGATLIISANNLGVAALDNTGGTISATGAAGPGFPASLVILNNLYVAGGSLSTDSLGLIQTTAAPGLATSLADISLSGNLNAHNGTLQLTDVTLNGSLVQDSTSAIALAGTITNNAAWVQSAPANITLSNSSNIQGTGSITLNGGSISGIFSSEFLTIASKQTIQGSGSIGNTANGSLYNLGQIISNTPASLGLTINAALTNLGTLTVAPSSTMTVTAPLISTAGIIRDDGTLQLTASTNSVSTISGQGSLFVDAGVAAAPGLVFDSIQLNSLTLEGAAKIRPNTTPSSASKLQQLSFVTPNASLDLTNNALIIAATTSSTLSTLQSEITLGQSHATGLFTSLPNMVLALIDNAALSTPFTTFGGLPVDTNSILIASELLGDANIDGKVDLTDLNTVLNNLGTANTTWTSGNFDHAPTIDLTDLNTVLNNLGTTLPNLSVLSTQSSSLPTSTPEPASALLLTMGALLLTRRRSSAAEARGLPAPQRPKPPCAR